MLESVEAFKKEVMGQKDYILLITADPKSYQKTAINLLKTFVGKESTPGVYVTLNKPCSIIERNLAANKIDTRLIIFIDAASRGESGKVGNCLFIGTPEKLSDMSVAMDQAIKSLPTSEKFLIFDSLNTLAIFNTDSVVARFVHFLASKMREWKVKGVIITLEKETRQDLLEQMSQFADLRLDERES